MMSSPGAFSAAGAADRLGEQLVGPLGGALVGQVQRDVGRHHADQRHGGHIEALGHQRGTDQDIQPGRR